MFLHCSNWRDVPRSAFHAQNHDHGPARPDKLPAILRIALLFHASKVYDHETLAGIGKYVKQTRVDWNLFLEQDFRFRLDGIHEWEGEGIIADYDDPAVAQALLIPLAAP